MSLQVWLPLTKDLRNQGLSNVTVTNNGATFNSAGKLGGCYKTSSSGYIDLGYNGNQINSTSLSFGGWFKFNQSEISSAISGKTYTSSAKSATGNLIGNNSYGGISLQWNSNDIYTSGSFSSMSVQSYLRTSTNGARATSSFTLPFDTWIHIFLIYNKDENILGLWINGELKYTYTQVTFTDAVSRNLVLNYGAIAGGNGPSAYIPFLVNDVRIYDHCLSPMEVKELAKGLVLHYPLNRQGWGQENLISNSQLNGSWTYPSSSYSDKYSPTTLIVPSKSVYTLSFDAKSTVNGDKIRTHYYNPNTTTTCTSNQGVVKTATDGNMDFTLTTSWKRYWVIYNQSETTAVKHIICPRLVSGNGTGTVSVRNVKFEEGSVATPWCPNSLDALATTMGLNGTTEYDCSGFCNNGEYYAYDTNGSISYTSDTPKYNVSTHIASANSTTSAASGTRYLYGHCSLTNPTQMSVAFWLKPINGGYANNGGTTGQGYFCTTKYEYGNISVGSDYQDSAMNHRDSAVDINDSASTTQCRVSFIPTMGEWHHYVITYDGQVGRVYKDGVQTATAQFSTAKTLDSFVGVVIGFSKAGGVWRRNDACYSDFRIYATALSADDVKSLYQNSAYIDNSGNVYGAVHMEV